MAVLEDKPPQVRVAALNEKARLLGMEIGMTKLQAAIFAVPEEESVASAQSTTRSLSLEKVSANRTFVAARKEATEAYCSGSATTVAGAGGSRRTPRCWMSPMRSLRE